MPVLFPLNNQGGGRMPFLLLLQCPFSCSGTPGMLSPAPGNRGSGDASVCVGSQGGLDKDLGAALALISAPLA
jgi:hypothetical protein